MKVGRGSTLLIGGARSGKSDLAVRLALTWKDGVIVAATAEVGDDDMAERIERHKRDRPADWGLIEAPLLDAGDIVALDASSLLIIDCVTMLVTNLLLAGRTDRQIDEHASVLNHAIVSRTAPTLVITNEVGLGIVPDNEMGRRYRDLLGRYNRRLAERAETSVFIVAGQGLPLEAIEPDWS